MQPAANGEASTCDDAWAGGSVPTPKGRPMMDGGGGVTRGFPLKSGGLSNFIRRSGVTISYSNPFIDLSVHKKCPDLSNFCLCCFRNGLLHDKFGLALT
ncbi:hypothetical protein BCCH1_12540 [Burkholderia contaminans]|uniref:Uncharacterized protein n=1 Tax=Burkholderia contaminans TaxID=488447 RepID=A0A250L2J2_9BURK|nr:hypothetical protein BCCH1_12540 [Burkholderia contaminans]GLZ67602.1 hypothetical protein Bcon01_06470 [Burkholderia contaminans]